MVVMVVVVVVTKVTTFGVLVPHTICNLCKPNLTYKFNGLATNFFDGAHF